MCSRLNDGERMVAISLVTTEWMDCGKILVGTDKLARTRTSQSVDLRIGRALINSQKAETSPAIGGVLRQPAEHIAQRFSRRISNHRWITRIEKANDVFACTINTEQTIRVRLHRNLSRTPLHTDAHLPGDELDAHHRTTRSRIILSTLLFVTVLNAGNRDDSGL